MGLDANYPKDVHFGYKHDLPALRKKAVLDDTFKKEKQFTGFYHPIHHAVGCVIQRSAAHHLDRHSAKFCRGY